VVSRKFTGGFATTDSGTNCHIADHQVEWALPYIAQNREHQV
jgi:hypothetical protein